MKRLIITTIILLAAAVGVTVVYFKNLRPQGQRTSQLINTIPANAPFILEFNNDSTFYNIFKGNNLFTALMGKQAIDDLDTLRQQILLNPSLSKFFGDQNIFISLHPLKDNNIGLLLTTSVTKDFKIAVIDELAKQQNTGLVITPENIEGKKAYTIYSSVLKKRFYLINQEDDILLGSFSRELIVQSLKRNSKNPVPYTLVPDQQNSNSLANLYVNYSKINPLFDQLFTNKNTAIFKSFRLFSGLSALSLNFKSSALMFSGLTEIPKGVPIAYLDLFLNQQPVVNQLKNIFPSTTAYSMCFGVSGPSKFKKDLAEWQAAAGLQRERDSTFKKVKSETGINLVTEFNQLLSNEFAVVTTKYQEKLALISVKNGMTLKPILNNISTRITDNTGQFNYNKLPMFLLGDAFSVFRRPYYMIVDNYLILANSTKELDSYYDSYINRKYLIKTDEYKQFDNLLAERGNIAWLIILKNTDFELKRDMDAGFYSAFTSNEPGWKNYYAVSCQLATSGKNFYTNFCMNLNLTDTTQATNHIIHK